MFAYPTAEATLLPDDLLEDSARIYHRNVATIQRVFAQQWFWTLADRIGAEQIEYPNENPGRVEARAVMGLAGYRRALRAKEGELIAAERDKRAARDAAIWAFAGVRLLEIPAAASA